MTTPTEKSALTAEEIASTVLDKWPNIEMECDIDQLRSDITQAIKYERKRVRAETIRDALRCLSESTSHERYRELVRSNVAQQEWVKENKELHSQLAIKDKAIERLVDRIDRAAQLIEEDYFENWDTALEILVHSRNEPEVKAAREGK